MADGGPHRHGAAGDRAARTGHLPPGIYMVDYAPLSKMRRLEAALARVRTRRALRGAGEFAPQTPCLYPTSGVDAHARAPP